MRADRRTDMTKLIVAFRNFAKAPKKVNLSLCVNMHGLHEGVRGSCYTTPRILNISARWRFVVIFKPRFLYPVEGGSFCNRLSGERKVLMRVPFPVIEPQFRDRPAAA
jgi:hypothetical protein